MLSEELSRCLTLLPWFEAAEVPRWCQAPDEWPCVRLLCRQLPTDFQDLPAMVEWCCSFLCGGCGQSDESAGNRGLRIPSEKRIQASECSHERSHAYLRPSRRNAGTS